MADAEDLALELAEAVAERHVEGNEDHPAQLVGVAALGNHDGGQRGAVFRLIPAEDFEAPGSNGAPGRLAQPGVAGENLIQPFLVEHGDRLA